MFGSCVLYFCVLACTQSYLLKIRTQNSFGRKNKAFVKLKSHHFVCENEIAPAVRPPWYQNFKNRYHAKEALDELIFAKFKLPAADEITDQLTASKIEDWTMPCYKLDTRNVPVSIDTADLFDVRIKKNWVMDSRGAIDPVFLGYSQPFGREDQEHKPTLFETVVRTNDNFADCTSGASHTATYDEAQRTHNEVRKQAGTGEIEYFSYD